MSARPVQISIDAELLKRIDSDPEVSREGRSAFVRKAVLMYLDSKRRQDVDERIRRAFAGRAEESASEIEDLMEAQTWPEH